MSQALSFPLSIPAPTHFAAYARAAQALPMLSEVQEQQLVERWRNEEDRDAARQLVLSHLRLVVKVVRDHEGYGMAAGDLAQEGTVGLMKAVHRFLPQRGVRLASYALPWIEAEVREYILRNWRLVRMATSGWAKKLFFGYRKAMAAVESLGPARPAQLKRSEVAQALGVELSHVEEAESYFAGRDMPLLPPGSGGVAEDGGAEDQAEGYLEALMQRGSEAASLQLPAPSPEEVCAQEQSHALVPRMITQALGQLGGRERLVIEKRLLSNPPAGLKELGEELGVSAERVRQLEKQALEKMRHALQPAHSLLMA